MDVIRAERGGERTLLSLKASAWELAGVSRRVRNVCFLRMEFPDCLYGAHFVFWDGKLGRGATLTGLFV